MRKVTPVVFLFFLSLALPPGAGQDLLTDAQDIPAPQVALVLSGGGARGAAHIGVIQVLEEAGVPIDLIVGASYGALVGGLYSVGYSARDLEVIVRDIDWNRMLDERPDRRLLNHDNKIRTDRGLLELQFNHFDLNLPQGLQAGQRISQMLDRLTADPLLKVGNDFDRLRIRFRAVATDLMTGQAHLFANGSMTTALRASMAVPAAFTPVPFQGTLLIDGGVADNLPVRVARSLGARIILAVDVSTPLRRDPSQIRSLVDVLDQTISLHIEESLSASRREADLLIQPDLEGFTSIDFQKASDLVARGRDGAKPHLERIRDLLAGHGLGTGSTGAQPSLLGSDRFDSESFVLESAPLIPSKIDVEGNKRYPAREVKRLAGAQPGRATTISDIDENVAELYASDLFRIASFRLQGDPRQPQLAYVVEEIPANHLGLGIRYDRDFKFTGAFELVSRRVFHRPVDLFSRVLVGNARSFEVGLDSGSRSGERLFLSSRLSYRSFDRLTFQDNQQAGDFQDKRLGWELSLNRLIGAAGRASLSYRLERVSIDRLLLPIGDEDPTLLSGLKAAFAWDSFDRGDFPSQGRKAGVSIDWKSSSLGGDRDFRRYRTSLEQRFRLAGVHSLGLRGSWNLVRGDAPFHDLIFTGGLQYFDFSSDRFAGLMRDQRRSQQSLVLEASYRHRLREFQLGAVRALYLEGIYNGGFFSTSSTIGELGAPLHGFAVGALADVRYLGPLRVHIGKAEDSRWISYFSMGYRF